MVLGFGFCCFPPPLHFANNWQWLGFGNEIFPKRLFVVENVIFAGNFKEKKKNERRFPPPCHSQFKMNITPLIAGFPAPRELGFRLGNGA